MSTLNLIIQTSTLERLLFLGFLGFLLSMIITPFYTWMAFKWQWWKKPRTTAISGEKAVEFQKLNKKKH